MTTEAKGTAPLYRPGDRVELVTTTDPYTELRPGDQGTVTHFDASTQHLGIHWDSGSTLGMLLHRGDIVRLVATPPDAPVVGAAQTG